MSNTLTPAQRSLVSVAARGFTVTDAAELKAHRALVALSDSGLSYARIAGHLKDTGAKFAPSTSRIGVIVKYLRTVPQDITAVDYATGLKAATKAASGDTSRKRPEGAAKAAPEATAPVTARQIADAIMILVDASKALDAADRARLAALYAAAATEVMPRVAAVA